MYINSIQFSIYAVYAVYTRYTHAGITWVPRLLKVIPRYNEVVIIQDYVGNFVVPDTFHNYVNNTRHLIFRIY